MAPTSSASLLFHPKVKKEPNDRTSVTPRKSTTPRPKPKEEEEDMTKLPEGPFQDFRLMSSALNGWKYDVMKFDSRRSVDISSWQTPIKLNRKESKRDEGTAGTGMPEAVGPMVGPDGKPVIGADGRIVMVDVDGRPIHATDSSVGNGNGGGKDAKGKGVANGRKKFQKKTRQVYKIPEATRQLRREERYPWVMEDSSQKEVWLGKLEDVHKSETHAFFMPAANDVFKFVPAHRWYKFQKKPNYHIPNLEEAESIMAKLQKNKDPERWLLHNRNGKAPSSATAAIFKAEAEGRVLSTGNSLVQNAGQSLGPGGRRLRAVDSGADGLFGDDDEDGDAKRRRQRELGGEGDLDEQVYEEDFADDEEKMEDDQDDEETKELEERLKREYKNANKTREGYVDESEGDDDDEGKLTKDGKAMKKLIRNLEKNNAYDSDEEKNPYASSEEEEEEEEPPAPPEPAVQLQQPPSRSGSPTPKNSQTPSARPSGTDSRATSPAAPGLGGHSVVAKRATSPKAPKMKTGNASRGNSPLAGSPPSRATSPPSGSRATSPINGVASGSRAGSPVALSPAGTAAKPSNKRKATEDLATGAPSPGGNALPKPKKRKAQPPGGGVVPSGELEDRMVIEWLRNTPNATTRDCIQHFTPYLTDEAKKSKFTALVKEVAQLKGGVLVLRNAYRGSAAPSPGSTVETK